ncbi:hydroxyacid dehydrogenase [Bacillus thuringiensis]|nr:D-lactate dehydrogenase [Bacillus thuringiensis serovar thuringiensis str. IS5056]MED1734660.1 hydroxyacid dehydrogenase [Bacillus thuringiensis]MED1765190.1 hydroxyacid dehydrogenase [Bacillus thuringiensis]MED2735894.1 hydroxyacid dehydrogenase [Bacillus thuringiensis]
MGSNTDEALTNMIETSFENLHDIITKRHIANAVPLPKKRELDSIN